MEELPSERELESLTGQRDGAIERIVPGAGLHTHEIEFEHISRYRWASRNLSGGHTLDIAAGTGYGRRELPADWRVVSCDVHVDSLRFGSTAYGITGVAADGLRLPFRDAAFDSVVSLETIEHVPSPEHFASELARVSRPGAHLVLSTPNADESEGANPHHLREVNLAELGGILGDAGFRVEKVAGQHWRMWPRRLARVRGPRRVLWEIERRAAIHAWPTALGAPVYWVIVATRQPR